MAAEPRPIVPSPAPTFFATAAAFRAWLDRHAATSREIVVGFWKVGSGTPSMTWSEAVDEALCVGWIDGVTKRVDERAYQIRFTPRKPASIWSAVNIRKFHALEAEGRMTDAGRAAFARRTAGKSAIYSHERTTPPELTAEETRTFEGNGPAWRYFEACPPGYRRQILHWITTAKKPETRARRLAKTIEACTAGTRLL